MCRQLQLGGFYNDPMGQKGPDMAKKYYSNERTQDSGMISEDRGAIANLPQNVIMKNYAASSYMTYSPLDDTIRVIEVQTKDDATGKGIKKGKMPEKW